MEKKQFIQIPLELFRDQELYSEINECLPLYCYLQSCIFRGEHGGDKYRLHDNYFKLGYLATAVSTEKLAKVHKCCENTIRKWRTILKNCGFIKIEYTTIMIKNKKGKTIKAKPYIYILGNNIDGLPCYYARDICIARASV